MADRHAQILALLQTRFDHLPAPVRHTHTSAGFVDNADAHVTCPDCFGEMPGRVGCETCRSQGFLVEERRRDPYRVEHVAPYGLDQAGHERAREVDAQLGRLEQQLRAPWKSAADELADANLHPYGWEQARRLMYARFDYRALDVALETLHAAWPGVAASSTRGLGFLDPRMPSPIRAPLAGNAAVVVNVNAKGRAADPRARAQRDELVLALARQGVDYGEIAAKVGLSAAQLRRIVNRPDVAA